MQSVASVKLNKIDAMKFKLTLQFKNLNLMIEHNSLMQKMGTEESQKKEYRISKNQQITRLERELDRSKKQVQDELKGFYQNGYEQVNPQLVSELERLVSDVEQYFQQKAIRDNQTALVTRNYSKIKSKINSGIKNGQLADIRSRLPSTLELKKH